MRIEFTDNYIIKATYFEELLFSKLKLVWNNARNMGIPMRIEITSNNCHIANQDVIQTALAVWTSRQTSFLIF